MPGGQRMEMMSRDKWLVLDAGAVRPVDALSLLGIVDSLGRARVSLEVRTRRAVRGGASAAFARWARRCDGSALHSPRPASNHPLRASSASTCVARVTRRLATACTA